MIKPNSGQLKGFRIVRDPEGILFGSFETMGIKYGYIFTYGEGVPSIHNGDTWVPVIETDEKTFEDSLQNLLIEQGTKISLAAATNPAYAELAAMMNVGVVQAAPETAQPIYYKS